jgi:hypothetical protein
MLIILKSTISVVQFDVKDKVLHIDMMPMTTKHTRLSALVMIGNKLSGLFAESESVHRKMAIFSMLGEACEVCRFSEDLLEIKVEGKGAVYYEIGKPALDLLGMVFSAMKWEK